ncbi:MAG: MATE family efflux transporter [Spirochaetes bacterium]|nr:MATE family efflux transporter [Spirochaetota bacterium]
MHPPKPNAAERLGTESVGKLLLQFSIPAITGMLAGALYNVIDRIFIGRAVGEIAMGGVGLVMPLMTIGMAWAMLFGMGTANMISMRLGQGKRGDAENALNHCFFLLIAAGLFLMVSGLLLLEPLLGLLGAQEGSEALAFAREYFRITLFGSVFGLLGFGLAHCTRAQGFPKITMACLLIGAILNIILSALFVLAFDWGVQGAAWATVVSQLVSAAWIFNFIRGKKPVVRLNLQAFAPSRAIVRQIMAFGSAQFLIQFAMSAVQFLFNQSMGWYGAVALGVPNGGDIALAGINIYFAMMMLIMMPVFGISQGAQPLIGFNYGAKNYRRVFSIYIRAIGVATGICFAGFIALQLFSVQIVLLFAPDASAELMYFTPRAMRTMSILLPSAGFYILSMIFFTVTGRPKLSIFMSMLRQCIILIPCMLIFGRLFGLWGVLAAVPVADAFALVLAWFLISKEMKKLRGHVPPETSGPAG